MLKLTKAKVHKMISTQSLFNGGGTITKTFDRFLWCTWRYRKSVIEKIPQLCIDIRDVIWYEMEKDVDGSYIRLYTISSSEQDKEKMTKLFLSALTAHLNNPKTKKRK